MTLPVVIGWAVAVWTGATLVGVSALGIYACLWREYSPTAPWQVRAVFRIGQVLIAWVGIVVLASLTYATVLGLHTALTTR